MLAESSCNTIAITELLLTDHYDIANSILQTCEANGLKTHIIKGASDYWCRDFMPILVNNDRFVQFVYDPFYYKNSKYHHLKTDLAFVPTYGNSTDILACHLIKTILPQYSIIPIPVNDLSVKGGVLHCATWNVQR